MSKTLDTSYVNHTSNVAFHKDVLVDLYQHRFIGIHYSDFPSLDETEWKDIEKDSTGGNAVGRLCEYAKEGRILTASYTGHPDLDGGRLVGTVGATNTDETAETLLIVVRNESVEGKKPGVVDYLRLDGAATLEDVESSLDEVNDEAREPLERAVDNRGFGQDDPPYRIAKGLEFNEDVEWVWNRDFPGLWAANKRQTIAGWNKGSVHLRVAYEAACGAGLDDMRDWNGSSEKSEKEPVRMLSPGQLEVLCTEYVRRKHDGFVELLPVGGSLQGVDIVGEAKDREVLAQVTFADDVSEKFQRLLSYAGHAAAEDPPRFYFFGPCEGKQKLDPPESSKPLDKIYQPIECVFEKFETGASEVQADAKHAKPPEEILDRLLAVELSAEEPPDPN